MLGSEQGVHTLNREYTLTTGISRMYTMFIQFTLQLVPLNLMWLSDLCFCSKAEGRLTASIYGGCCWMKFVNQFYSVFYFCCLFIAICYQAVIVCTMFHRWRLGPSIVEDRCPSTNLQNCSSSNVTLHVDLCDMALSLTEIIVRTGWIFQNVINYVDLVKWHQS